MKSLHIPHAVQDDGVTTASSGAGSPIAAHPWPYGAPATVSNVTPIRSVSGRRAGPVQAADMAQAQLFSALLRDEIAELEDVAEAAERRWLQLRVRGTGNDQLPPELVRLGERVAEAHRLLNALQQRFPHK
ncbi:hypothetical protein [Mycolicibacterium komossense]|uniref:Uncharacterized protein n=1 Tax=Mycolicibacterium komossense TaxID=1779 RepID=A0ABT3C8D4_9MYCO|nr:hypothetical protein [Mycolicibacterium komossense]MCV7225747.1 hypothetical protein [Mycolicibacterium komossense]